MARLTRYTQQVFGSSAGASQIAQLGSLAAGSPVTYSGTTITPAIVQSLSNYLSGWLSIVVGANSPAIEDMNALCYLYAYQLTYLLQLGVPEWDSGTTYYAGSIVNDGTGILYTSLANANLNNALTNTTYWRPQPIVSQASLQSGTFGYNLTAADQGRVFICALTQTSQFNLPAPIANFEFTIKDQTGVFNSNGAITMTVHRYASEKIENLAADYICGAAYGEWTFICDGTNWSICGR